MLALPVALCICNVRQEGRAGSMLLLYIDEAMIYDILDLAVSEKALFYTGSYGRVRMKRNEINQSLLAYWLCVRARVRAILAEGMPGRTRGRKRVLILVCPAVHCPLLDIDWSH